MSSTKQRHLQNIERVKAWADAWALPGGSAERMVGEIYADAPEVVAMLQGNQVSTTTSGKAAWRQAEQRIEQHYASRQVLFDTFYPCGDTVAVEARVRMVTHEGEERSWPFAVFLTFDDDGRIVRDHTYMPDSPHGDLFERAAARVAGGDEPTEQL